MVLECIYILVDTTAATTDTREDEVHLHCSRVMDLHAKDFSKLIDATHEIGRESPL